MIQSLKLEFSVPCNVFILRVSGQRCHSIMSGNVVVSKSIMDDGVEDG